MPLKIIFISEDGS